MDKAKLYRELVTAFKNAHPTISHKEVDLQVSKIWREIKDDTNLISLVNENIQKWTVVANQKRNTLDRFWVSEIN